MFRDITAPYHTIESWFYDRAVAPVVTEIIEKHLDLLKPFLDAIPEDGRILDVGCGGGQLAISFARQHPGWRITGLDLSRDQARRAKKRGRGLGKQVQFVIGSALAMPFKPETVDGLISVCSIKHWHEPGKGLAECLRVLRPGGALVVVEVDREYHRDDGRAFVARQYIPGYFRSIAMYGFKWKIAARSLSKDEASALFNTLPVSITRAFTIPGMPLWMITAKKEKSNF
jgi:Methylase involved in ubiquinone/menaquinone biosynthesis